MKQKSSNKYLILVIVLGVVIVILLGVLIAGIIIKKNFVKKVEDFVEVKEVETDYSVEICEKFAEIGFLQTESYLLTEQLESEQAIETLGITLPFTTVSYKLQYDYCAKAGIDLGKVKVLKVSEDRYLVELPEIEISDSYIDTDSVKVLDQKDNLFNKVELEQVAALLNEHLEVDEVRAVENGLLRRAEEHAKEEIRAIVQTIAGEEVIVNFTDAL